MIKFLVKCNDILSVTNLPISYVTKREIIELESVDEILLRKIFSAHSKTPLETLYLESGNIPIRLILMSRRLDFLHYILNEDEDWEDSSQHNGSPR